MLLLTAALAAPYYMIHDTCDGFSFFGAAKAVIRNEVARHYRRNDRVMWVDGERVSPRDASLAVLFAAGCVQALSDGDEARVLLSDGGRLWPIAMRRDGGAMRFTTGPPVPPARTGATERLLETYGIRATTVNEAEWSPQFLAAIGTILERLTPGQLAVLRQSTFVLDAEASEQDHGPLRVAAHYEPARHIIRFFPATTELNRFFVGPVTDPHHSALHTIAHEIGHAVDLSLDGARERFVEEIGAEVTFYATTNDVEAFAEAFAVALLDPEAAERLAPGSVAFFKTLRPGASGAPPSKDPLPL